MAGANYLLDTVIVAAYFNRDAAVLERMKDVTVYVSIVTVGELYFGAYKSQRVTGNIERIRRFIALNNVLLCDEVAADYYGQVKQRLRAKGRPIPENDIWIAATALRYGLSVATRDAHFSEIEGLMVEVW